MLILLFALSAALASPSQDVPPAQPELGGATPVDALPPLAPGEIETVTRIRYTIGIDGKVSDCTTVSSDAPPDIQSAICQIFMKRARFTPELEDGNPVTITKERTVRFRIAENGTPPTTPPQPSKRDLPPGR